ncbi:MAG: rod shape-determining protein MreD [Candidatus Nanopelagicales bacterium]|jgi:rod shape-determining protein MreD
MVVRRLLLCLVLLLLAAVLELTLLAPLPFPGATPPLVLVTVAALAFAFGPTTGAVCGFVGGILLDVAPPAAGTLGIGALILTVVGYALGRLADPSDRRLLVGVGGTAAAGGLSVLAVAVLGGLLGNPRTQWGDVPGLIVTEVLYAALLAVLLVPLIQRLARRLVPEAFSR